MTIRVRFATVDDLSLLLNLIHQKAEFDGCPTSVETTADRLEQTLFGDVPLAHVLFAEVNNEVIGFASFFSSYSTFLARPGIWLDDLYVQPQMRGQGIGTALLSQLKAIAQENDCGRIEWTVATSNDNGIEFYKKQGAQINEAVRLCRLNRQAIQQSS